LLRLLHLLYSLVLAFSAWKKNAALTAPNTLAAKRKRLPEHLALLLVADDTADSDLTEAALVQSAESAVRWCREAGIECLSIYDHQGILENHSQEIEERLTVYNQPISDESTDSDVEYPLTPPISRPISPHYDGLDNNLGVITIDLTERREKVYSVATKRRRSQLNGSNPKPHPLTLHIVSSKSSKSAVLSTTRSLARTHTRKAAKTPAHKKVPDFHITIEALDSVLEGKHGFTSPDLMILHPLLPSEYNKAPMELHGFPPWQIRLTEIYHNRYHKQYRGWLNPIRMLFGTPPSPCPLDEVEFRRALDEFSGAEMRLGK